MLVRDVLIYHSLLENSEQNTRFIHFLKSVKTVLDLIKSLRREISLKVMRNSRMQDINSIEVEYR